MFKRIFAGVAVLGTGGVSGSLMYRSLQVKKLRQQLTQEIEDSEDSLQKLRDVHEKDVQVVQREVDELDVTLDGVHMLWSDRFRRYREAQELYQAYSAAMPDVFDLMDRVAELYHVWTPKLHVSDEYEFVSSKVHSISFLMPPRNATERRLLNFLFRGDPLVRTVSMSFDEVQDAPECNLRDLSVGLSTLTQRMQSHAADVKLQEQQRAAEELKHQREIALEAHKLKQSGLLGKITTETLQSAIIQNKDIVHTQEDPRAPPSYVELRDGADVEAALQYVENVSSQLPKNTPAAITEAAEEFKRAATAYLVREMGAASLGAFHTCLMHALIMRPAGQPDN